MEELYLNLLIKISESKCLAQCVLSMHEALYFVAEISEKWNSVPNTYIFVYVCICIDINDIFHTRETMCILYTFVAVYKLYYMNASYSLYLVICYYIIETSGTTPL